MDKQAVREVVWDAFEETGEADAADAAEADSDADVDDAPTVEDATTVSGISTHGTPVGPEEVPHVDLVVAGSVGVTTAGARIGKGEGYSDLEWGVLSELGAVDREAQSASGNRAKPDDSEALRASGNRAKLDDSEGQSPSGNRALPGDDETVVATTVHELSVLDGPKSAVASARDAGESLPAPDPHDVPLDLIVTPERTIRTETAYPRPTGIDWEKLDAKRLDEIPVLAERAPKNS